MPYQNETEEDEKVLNDTPDEYTPCREAGKRKSGIAYRRKMKVKHREQIRENTSYGNNRTWCGYKAAYVDWNFDGDDWHPSGNYVKYPKNSKGKGFWKKHANRFVRRSEDVYHGKQYKKACDYHIYTSY